MCYAVYSEATEAIMDIKLNDLIGERITKFHGTVKAWNSQVTGAISCIFEEEDFCVNIGKAGSMSIIVPLSRHAVLIPCNSSLFVQVDICRDNATFANKIIEYPARLGGEYVQIIPGVGGTIEVKGTWSSNDGSGKAEGWIAGGGSDTIEYQLYNISLQVIQTIVC